MERRNIWDSRECEKRRKRENLNQFEKLEGQLIFKPAAKGSKEVNTVQYFLGDGHLGVSIDLENTYMQYRCGHIIEEIAEKLISDLKNS